jgi:hypothetical protein
MNLFTLRPKRQPLHDAVVLSISYEAKRLHQSFVDSEKTANALDALGVDCFDSDVD